MSWTTYIIFITENKIDEMDVFTIFNKEIIAAIEEPPCYPDYYPEYHIYPSCSEEMPRPYYFYFNLLTVNGVASEKHCYAVKYGNYMFSRLKFPLIDHEAGICYDLHMKEQISVYDVQAWEGIGQGEPPYEALKEFFSYVQKNNDEMYLFIDDLDIEDEMSRSYIQDCINKKTVHVCSIEEAIKLGVNYYERPEPQQAPDFLNKSLSFDEFKKSMKLIYNNKLEKNKKLFRESIMHIKLK